MNKLIVYHGTNSLFGKFEQSKARLVNDFYGGGTAYFTDNYDVAKTYANSMSKKPPHGKFIYEVELVLKNTFDVDTIYEGEILKKLVGSQSEMFARGARLMNPGVDKYKIMAQLERGVIPLNGDTVFRGMSMGMVNTAKARETLKKSGFDSLRYNGGVNMGMATKHNVYLIYDASDARIKNIWDISNNKKTLVAVNP